MTKYPQIEVREGQYFAESVVISQMKKIKVPSSEINKFKKECLEGDKWMVINRWVKVVGSTK